MSDRPFRTAARRLALISAVAGGCLVPTAAFAEGASAHLEATGTPVGWAVIALFVLAYILVALEDHLRLRKSKPVMVAAALIWALIAWSAQGAGQQEIVNTAFRQIFLDYAELFFFLIVSMTFVDAMSERGVFDALRAMLVRRGFGYRALFWITGLVAFLLSSILNNLTTVLVVGSVVMALGANNKRFLTVSCVNIVVASNAGGAWSAFGDITTLMVWQAHRAEFFDFFRLFVPALVNWLVPALAMMLALPRGKPPPGNASSTIKFGGVAMCALFALTIAITVLAKQVLHLPPVFGMLAGLALLQMLAYVICLREPSYDESDTTTANFAHDPRGYSIFNIIARAEWDTLLFFYGVLLSVGGLATLGYLELVSRQLYGHMGATAANTIFGILSAVIDNIPIMSAVLQMSPNMDHAQWLLVTLTCGVGGSLLSIGSAAGVAMMGTARDDYTFMSHLRWSWAIALGFIASVMVHLALNSPAH